MKAETILVVGAGMVGHRVCSRLRELDPKRRRRIVLIGEEPRAPYDRVHLTQYYESRDAAELALAPDEFFTERAIELRVNLAVTGIDREARHVVYADRSREPYDQLVLTTGSAPFIPRLPGIDRAGVFPYRTIDDLIAIETYAKQARSVAVLGGGLLGLE